MTAPVFDSSSLPFVEEMLARWTADPASVDREWQAYFSGWFAASGLQDDRVTGSQGGGEGLYRFVEAWRTKAFEYADVNPLEAAPARGAELDPATYGLGVGELPAGLAENLQRAYGGTTGIECGAVQDAVARAWVQDWWEAAPAPVAPEVQKVLYEQLVKANTFERYLHTKFVGAKRFSIEGTDAFVPMLVTLADRFAEDGGQQLLLGMAHRGRLNVMCNVFHKPYAELFAGFAETLNDVGGASSGDVKYHLGKKHAYRAANGATVNLTLPFNPSHLETVDAILAGSAKGFEDAGEKVLPVIVHGDASVAGQGIVAELYNFVGVPGYDVGGIIHVVMNNQIGFTAEPFESLGGKWCTDNFRAVGGPIVHVNADDVEACYRAMMFAYEYRARFNGDVMLDVIGYRRWGHNEGDDPMFTQPLMYEKIRNHPVPADIYKVKLNLDASEAEKVSGAFLNELNAAFAAAQQGGVKVSQQASPRLQPDAKPVATAIVPEVVKQIAATWAKLPDDFAVNEKVGKVLDDRAAMLRGEKDLNWGAAETAAYGALVGEGIPVRISGEDAQRGTFSHRHAVLVDQKTAKRLTPLNRLGVKGAALEIFNSPLSEYAAMGFEYGYALERPGTLTIWEGQFGDFANGAQIIIDQFLAAAGAKWGQANGLTLLLPHGYEGQGPEHSSARVERFLQLCAEGNMSVAMPSSPAQVFHLLRRQALRHQRVPLVAFTPKSLLRHPMAVSPVKELTDGEWQPVISNPLSVIGKKPKRVILCAGKIYYDLLAKVNEAKLEGIALIRLEQFYPFPAAEVAAALKAVGAQSIAKLAVCWVQEEPRNMGAWNFVRDNWNNEWGFLHYVGRVASASPAVGSLKRHQAEQAKVIAEALGIE